MDWSVGDVALFAGMIAAAAGLFALAARAGRGLTYRAGAAVAILGLFGLVWVALAVGVFADPGDPADLLVMALAGFVLIGAAVVRLRPAGMARVAGLAAAGLGVLALAGAGVALARGAGAGALGVLGGLALFAALFAASSALFRRSARPAA